MTGVFDADVGHFESRYAGDRSVFAKFYYTPQKDEEASAQAGMPKFKDVLFVEIMVAGDANNVIQRQASDQDIERFRKVYDLFMSGAEEQTLGTPLSEVAWLTRSQVEELMYHKIRTLEALSTVSDDACGRLPGLYTLKEKAKAHVARADSAAPTEELRAKNEKLEEEVAALKKIVEDQTALLKELSAKKEK